MKKVLFGAAILFVTFRLARRQIITALALAAVVCLTAQSARATATNLVIAEIYGGGGNSGATLKNDFIVVFNPTVSGVDVNGWSVQYASATGTGSWQVTPLATSSTIIPAGRYFLVQEAQGTGGTTDLPTPDATGTIAMSATAGKVALCNSTTALSGACPADASIIDLVGFGATANCSETSPTPAPSNTTSVQRNGGGCDDTGNNSADFTATAPNPRNSSSPTHSCIISQPTIDTQPQSRTNNAGTTATFTVAASGGALSYLWKKDGSDITDLNASGTTTATLTITNVIAANAGSYRVTVTNTAGSTNSVAVTLTVMDPAINIQPASRVNVPGDVGNFFVSAGGTPTLTYQWRKSSTNIAGATTASLNVTNVQSSDAGNYSVVVSNGLGGAVTSSVATLAVLATPPTRITRWNFNDSGASPISPAPSEGTGTASLIGGVEPTTAAFPSGSFSDPNEPDGLPNFGWNTDTYPTNNNTANNKTAGARFDVSTVGYKRILLTWEERHSATASKYCRLQYSIDGLAFIDVLPVTLPDAGNFHFYFADLTSVTGVNNNPNFAFRIVSEYESTATGGGTTNYVGTANTYGTSGTIRFDLVSVYGHSGPTLNIARSGNNVVFTWSDATFSLQAAPLVTGTYTNVTGAVSGYSTPLSGSQRYFRLAKSVP